jgi:hypothetical protein
MRFGIEGLGIQAPPPAPWGNVVDRVQAVSDVNASCEALTKMFLIDHADFEDVFANLTDVKHVMQTYGASEGFCMFINAGNAFTNATGFEIPKLTEANKAEVSAGIEAAAEGKLKQTWTAFVEFLKKLIERIKEFFKKLIDREYSNMKALEALLKDGKLSKVSEIDADEFKKIAFKGFTHEEAGRLVTALKHIATELKYNDDGSVNFEAIKTQLAGLGLVVNGAKVDVDAAAAEKVAVPQDLVAGDAGWTPENLAAVCREVISMFELSKHYATLGKTMVDTLEKSIKDEDNTKTKAGAENAKQVLKVISGVYGKVSLALASMIESMAGQAKLKAAPAAEPKKE